MAVLVVWYASGVGYCMSALLAPQNALTASVAAIMLLGGFLNGVQPSYVSLSPFMKHAVGEQPEPPIIVPASRSWCIAHRHLLGVRLTAWLPWCPGHPILPAGHHMHT